MCPDALPRPAADGAVALARLPTARAHRAGLSVAQNNTGELAPQGRAIGLGFAELCQLYDECDAYADVYGARVLEIEYIEDGPEPFSEACSVRRGRASLLLRDRELSRPSQPGYVYRSC